MATNHARRLNTLTKWMQPKCRRCYGTPIRVITVDDNTGDILTENLPPTGCPECGKPILRELRIVADTSGEYIAHGYQVQGNDDDR